MYGYYYNYIFYKYNTPLDNYTSDYMLVKEDNINLCVKKNQILRIV